VPASNYWTLRRTADDLGTFKFGVEFLFIARGLRGSKGVGLRRLLFPFVDVVRFGCIW
jgi:hypothetical protein